MKKPVLALAVLGSVIGVSLTAFAYDDRRDHDWNDEYWHHHHYGFGGPRVFIGGPAYYGGGYGGCYARRLVPTPWGPRWRLVNRCY